MADWRKVLHILCVAALAVAGAAGAEEQGVVVLSDTVTGNQEQPKVLYIVPWQAAEDDSMLKQPLATRLHDQVFEHVERAEHLRELNYLQSLSQPSQDRAR